MYQLYLVCYVIITRFDVISSAANPVLHGKLSALPCPFNFTTGREQLKDWHTLFESPGVRVIKHLEARRFMIS